MIPRSLALAGCALALLAPAAAQEADIAQRIAGLTKSTAWEQVAAQPLDFKTNHTQGMVKIGDAYFVSSVEIITPTKRYDTPQDGYDRDTGEGRGFLYKFDAEGKLIGEVELGEGTIYHPGGIDFDGESIWVPVAEYRPNSASIIYRVNPETLEAEEVFRFADHIGGLVHNLDDNTLHGVSWGSRRFYGWALDGEGKVVDTGKAPTELAVANPSHYIDYQDCKYVGGQAMLCSGLSAYTPPGGAPNFALGGLELVSLADNRPVHQVPVPLWSETGRPMTQNPFFVETTESGLRAYFIPDDDDSTLFVYEARTE